MTDGLQKLELSTPQWVGLITSSHSAEVFHHPSWVQLIADCYGYRTMLLADVDGSSGQVLAGLPFTEVRSRLTGHRMVALPFSDFVQPLVRDGYELSEFARRLEKWRRSEGVRRLEVHWTLPVQDGVYYGEPVANHITPLSADPDEVFHSFKKKQVRENIRFAQRAGVVVRMGEEWNDLRLFYGLLIQTRRRLGAPVQPLRFFRLLWERILSQGLGFLLLAYEGSHLLAGGVFLNWNEILVSKYSASDPAYWRLRANNLIKWHAIKWGCEHGFRLFDWGRTDLDSQGLLDFKRSWGPREDVVRYSILADESPPPGLNSSSRRVLASIIRSSPTWVCRVVGELLYGHSA